MIQRKLSSSELKTRAALFDTGMELIEKIESTSLQRITAGDKSPELATIWGLSKGFLSSVIVLTGAGTGARTSDIEEESETEANTRDSIASAGNA